MQERMRKIDKIIAALSALTKFAEAFTLGFAVFQLVNAARGIMEKNPQKREEAKDNIKYIAIGVILCVSAEIIINYLKTL